MFNAVDYVLKPFEKARIAKAVQRARREIEASTSPAERLEQLVSQLGNVAKQTSPQPVKLQCNPASGSLVDSEDVIFARIDGGMISVVALDLEGSSNYRTLEDMQEVNVVAATFRWPSTECGYNSCKGIMPAARFPSLAPSMPSPLQTALHCLRKTSSGVTLYRLDDI